jgi:hypothetical protein
MVAMEIFPFKEKFPWQNREFDPGLMINRQKL